MAHQIIEGERLTAYCTELARFEGRPLFEWLTQRAMEMEMAGATVHKAVSGFGQHRRLHHQHLLSLSDDLPMSVQIIDIADRIDAFLQAAEEALAGHTYIREKVRWHRPEA